MRLLYHQVAALQTMAVGIVGKLVNGILLLKIVDQLQHLLELLHLMPVVISVGVCKLQD